MGGLSCTTNPARRVESEYIAAKLEGIGRVLVELLRGYWQGIGGYWWVLGGIATLVELWRTCKTTVNMQRELSGRGMRETENAGELNLL